MKRHLFLFTILNHYLDGFSHLVFDQPKSILISKDHLLYFTFIRGLNLNGREKKTNISDSGKCNQMLEF